MTLRLDPLNPVHRSTIGLARRLVSASGGGAAAGLEPGAPVNRWALASRYLAPGIVFAAAAPAAGWLLPSVWLVVMIGLVLVERPWDLAAGRRGASDRIVQAGQLLTSCGYAAAAFYLINLPNLSEKVFATTLFGMVMFKILVRDYAASSRLLINLSPMMLAVAFAVTPAVVHFLQLNRPGAVLTVLAAPLLVALLFKTLERDLSESRRRILEGRKAAEAAAEAKAEFLANMSHEIRTPLTGIIGFTGLLSEYPGLPEQARTHVRRIQTSGAGLLAVVNDILDFSKLDAGRLELDPHPFDVAAFFEDNLALFDEQAAAKGLALGATMAPGVPAMVDADAARLRQILANLMSNALKFTRAGSIQVSVGYDTAREVLQVSVADTGEGIAPDTLERLFARFTQADGSVSRRYGGTGLGLSICKSLAELMGGEVRVVSAIGVGSTFSFEVRAPAFDGDLGVRAAPRGDAEAEALSSQAILVVDDLDVNRELIRALLEAVGHRVTEADSGASALQQAATGAFDLILMDLQMPGMDGFTAARALRRSNTVNATTPIIALSANVLAEHVLTSAQAGMNDHLAKPIVLPALIETIARWGGVRVAAEPGAAFVDAA